MYSRHPNPNATSSYSNNTEQKEAQEVLKPSAYTSSIASPKTPVHRDPNIANNTRSHSPKRERSIPRKRTIHHQTNSFPRPTLVVMLLLPAAVLLYVVSFANGSSGSRLSARQNSCPDYKLYAARPHPPYTSGKYALPYQRPSPECRLFESKAVDNLIQEMVAKIANPDVARLFENAYPNTLDTTVRWHVDGGAENAQSFIVTGDIDAQWLRDSTNQLSQYQRLVKDDPKLKELILGAINTQAEYVLTSPYCNAFQPPAKSGLSPSNNGQDDSVHPLYDPTLVFECKYEIDSLANFLSLANQYYSHSSDTSFITKKFLDAVETVLTVIKQQQSGTFSSAGAPNDVVYTFQRRTSIGTETLNLGGIGNPLASNTSLVRSAFRPSDDATILQFFIPGNAMLSVELKRLSALLKSTGHTTHSVACETHSAAIESAVKKYGIVSHPVYGKVYAYEVDGYGSHIIMDDANLPSLLSLPLLGFVSVDDPVYQNTRRMLLEQQGNPYFLRGKQGQGVGGPHIGIRNAWPMSLLVQIMTSNDDNEISGLLEKVLEMCPLGLVNESVNVDRLSQYTRSWFAWANAVFAQTIFDLAERKPHLLFKKGNT